MATRTDRNQVFDSAGNVLSEETVQIDVTAETVKLSLVAGAKTILGQVAAARAQLAAIAAGPASPTNAQLATALKQVAAIEDTLVVCVDRLIRLTLADVAPELLVEGTP